MSETAKPHQAKRFQVPRACDRCKSLRRGCSELRPCQRCVKAGLSHQCLSTSPTIVRQSPSVPFREWEDALRKLNDLVQDMAIIDYCADRFFERLHPTIPILTSAYVEQLKAESVLTAGAEARCTLAAMCSQVLIQTEEPDGVFHQSIFPEKNGGYGRGLFENTVLSYRCLPRQSNPSLNQCLIAFFLYACQVRLSHHSQAFVFLREVTTLLTLLRVPDAEPVPKELADRLFWVALVSERSHAIRYSRPTTLQVTLDTPGFETGDSSLTGFWALTALFRPIDTTVVALLNRELFAEEPSRQLLSRVETSVNGAIKPSVSLLDTQKANLRITQLWLRVIIWQLRLRLGYLTDESYQHSLTYQYPLLIAKDLVLSTRDLPIESIRVHGVGITEKLFDIASAVIDVLAKIPLRDTANRGMTLDAPPEDDLKYIRHIVRQLPDGHAMYDNLLEKHIQQALPQFTPSPGLP